jgi:hypothetical protein
MAPVPIRRSIMQTLRYGSKQARKQAGGKLRARDPCLWTPASANLATDILHKTDSQIHAQRSCARAQRHIPRLLARKQQPYKQLKVTWGNWPKVEADACHEACTHDLAGNQRRTKSSKDGVLGRPPPDGDNRPTAAHAHVHSRMCIHHTSECATASASWRTVLVRAEQEGAACRTGGGGESVEL